LSDEVQLISKMPSDGYPLWVLGCNHYSPSASSHLFYYTTGFYHFPKLEYTT